MTTQTMLRIDVEGAASILEVPQPGGLSVLQDAVGGMIEYVAFPNRGIGCYLNEEGKLDGLEPNVIGTRLWLSAYGPTDVIVGPIVLLGDRTTDEGFSIGLTPEQLATLVQEFGLVINTDADPPPDGLPVAGCVVWEDDDEGM
jgi:hypothetical protein